MKQKINVKRQMGEYKKPKLHVNGQKHNVHAAQTSMFYSCTFGEQNQSGCATGYNPG